MCLKTERSKFGAFWNRSVVESFGFRTFGWSTEPKPNVRFSDVLYIKKKNYIYAYIYKRSSLVIKMNRKKKINRTARMSEIGTQKRSVSQTERSDFWHLLYSSTVSSHLCVCEASAVEKVAADHHSRSSFSGFAMNGGHVPLVFRQPSVNIFAEGTDERKIRRVVVVKGVML